MPVIEHMRAHRRGADLICVDETRAPVLDPGRKAIRSGYFRAVVADGGPSCRHAFETDGEPEAAFWAHLRRDFHDVWTSTGSAIAREALDRIGLRHCV